MKTHEFEIKVAILGHVSVGKTTLLNAILGDKYSEVSKKRTTAGINHFRISSLTKEDISKDDKVARSTNKQSEDEDVVDASKTLNQITSSNLALRKQQKIKEDVFDIELDKSLFEMHPNTRLVITDIPGLNEAGTRDMYLNFVKESWDRFDCVIILMDATQGVNAQEQVDLLHFAKENTLYKKKLPLFVLCNKVDDSDDGELMGLVQEVRLKVEEIFGVHDRKKALKSLLQTHEIKNDSSPVFLAISTQNAFLYRSASRLNRSDLHKLGKEYIDKIGYEEVGKFQWKKLNDEKKHDLVYSVVSEPSQLQERLASSNFDKLLEALKIFIGGKKRQNQLIVNQLDIITNKLSSKSSFANDLSIIFDKSKTLGKPTDGLCKRFFNLYEECKEKALEQFRENPRNNHKLYKPMSELIAYHQGLYAKMTNALQSSNESTTSLLYLNIESIANSALDLVKAQIKIIIEKMISYNNSFTVDSMDAILGIDPWEYKENGHFIGPGGFKYHSHISHIARLSKNDKNPKHPEANKYASHWKWNEEKKLWCSKYNSQTKTGKKNKNPLEEKSWETLLPRDWANLFSSILVMKYNKHFCETLSKEISDLEWHNDVKYTVSEIVKTSKNFNIDKQSATMLVPDHPSHEEHWGHLIWMYCNLRERIE